MRRQTDSANSAPPIATRFSTDAFGRPTSTHDSHYHNAALSQSAARDSTSLESIGASPVVRLASRTAVMTNTILVSARRPSGSSPHVAGRGGVEHNTARFFGVSQVPGISDKFIARSGDPTGNAVMVASCCYRLSALDVQTVTYVVYICKDRAISKARIERGGSEHLMHANGQYRPSTFSKLDGFVQMAMPDTSRGSYRPHGKSNG